MTETKAITVTLRSWITPLVVRVLPGGMYPPALLSAWRSVRLYIRVPYSAWKRRLVMSSSRLARKARQAMRELEASVVLRDRLSEQRRSLGVYAGLLQSCQTLEEIVQLSIDTIRRLVPDASGRFYLIRASQNFHDSVASFGDHLISSPDSLTAFTSGRTPR